MFLLVAVIGASWAWGWHAHRTDGLPTSFIVDLADEDAEQADIEP